MAGVRRTWDTAAYAEKAKERMERGDDVPEPIVKSKKTSISREEFQYAPDDSSGPMGSERAFLSARKSKLDLEEKAGKIEIIKPNAAGEGSGPSGPGYWCEVCQCLLKDSASYLDHINGKKHQRALGYSMRVERVGVDSVREKLAALKKQKEEKEAKSLLPKKSAFEQYEEKLMEKKKEREDLKRRRKEDEAKAKEEDIAANEAESSDVALSAFGFGSFGSSKK